MLYELENNVADEEKLEDPEVERLNVLGMLLSQWNISHPLPLVGGGAVLRDGEIQQS